MLFILDDELSTFAWTAVWPAVTAMHKILHPKRVLIVHDALPRSCIHYKAYAPLRVVFEVELVLMWATRVLGVVIVGQWCTDPRPCCPPAIAVWWCTPPWRQLGDACQCRARLRHIAQLVRHGFGN